MRFHDDSNLRKRLITKKRKEKKIFLQGIFAQRGGGPSFHQNGSKKGVV
jgi:hypothetical protein